MKEPVIVQKISQLREGSLNLKFGSPVRFVYQPIILLGLLLPTVDLPIIRSAGFPAALEEVAGTASFDEGFSAMIEALLQATSS